MVQQQQVCKTSSDRAIFFCVARNGRLKEVIELSRIFDNDVDVLNEALVESCRRGRSRLDVVNWFEEYTAADVNYNNWEVLLQNPSLIAACVRDPLDIVNYLMETCLSMEITLLTRVCRYVNMSVSMFLLYEVSDLDANINKRHDGNTVLHYVVWCCKDDYAKLHWACERGNVTEVLNLAYERGHKINVQDNDGYTPLHTACCYSDILESLILERADWTITSKKGRLLHKWLRV